MRKCVPLFTEGKIMATHRMSFADTNLLNQVVTPEVLSPMVPRIGEIADGVTNYRNMMHEIYKIGKHTRATGFTPIGQRVACIPYSVKAAVQEILPMAFEDKKIFYALLAGPLKAYDMRAKMVL